MAKRITFQSSDIVFPPQCANCSADNPNQNWSISRTGYYGGEAVTLFFDVPLCDSCYSTASKKNAIEIAVPWVFALFGVLIAVGMMSQLSKPSTFSLIITGVIFAFVFLLIGLFLVAPLFGSKESKKIRNCVTIEDFKLDRIDGQLVPFAVSLSVTNDDFADYLESLNLEEVLKIELKR